LKRTGFCLLVLVPLWFLLPVGPGAGQDQPGLAAYRKGDFANAFEETRPYAEAGDAGAQRLLGASYGGEEGSSGFDHPL
jgi:hypothetical protein